MMTSAILLSPYAGTLFSRRSHSTCRRRHSAPRELLYCQRYTVSAAKETGAKMLPATRMKESDIIQRLLYRALALISSGAEIIAFTAGGRDYGEIALMVAPASPDWPADYRWRWKTEYCTGAELHKLLSILPFDRCFGRGDSESLPPILVRKGGQQQYLAAIVEG